MNRQPLADLNEEWVERMARYVQEFDRGEHPTAAIALFNVEVHANRHLIIECMRTALKLKKELEAMGREERE